MLKMFKRQSKNTTVKSLRNLDISIDKTCLECWHTFETVRGRKIHEGRMQGRCA